jgi:pimeloyl-ACP methyl ester carboxylesterase/DNA-binding CsgD family transcriptional regulator
MSHWFLVHCVPGTPHWWDPLRAEVPSGATLEAWPLLDVGSREVPEASVDDLVRDVAERLAKLRAPVVLVGHGFGAWIAAHAAARVPERVERCVLIAGSVSTPPETARECRALADALDAGQITPATIAATASARWLTGDGPETRFRALIDVFFATESSARLARMLRRIADATAPVPCLPIPTVVLVGRRDNLLVQSCSDVLAERLGCVLERWPDAGHFLHWSNPARLARVLAPSAQFTPPSRPVELSPAESTSAFAAAVGHAQAKAFVGDEGDAVPFANAAERVRLDRGREQLRATLDLATRACSAAALRYGLTAREADVLQLLTRGTSNLSIAATHACSERTVEVHVARILRKFGCSTRAEVMARVLLESG